MKQRAIIFSLVALGLMLGGVEVLHAAKTGSQSIVPGQPYYVNVAGLNPSSASPINFQGCEQSVAPITAASAPLCTIPAAGIKITQSDKSCHLGGASTCQFAISNPSAATPTIDVTGGMHSGGTPTPTPKPGKTTQEQLFGKFGMGVDMGPHYKNQIYNSVYYAFVADDIKQLAQAGFKTFRFYDAYYLTYVNAIKAVAKYNAAHPNNKLNIIYQFSLCKSDPYHQTQGSNTCVDIAKTKPYEDKKTHKIVPPHWTSVGQIFSAQKAKLQKVIQAVGQQTFASVVPMIIVGNEDMIISHGFNYSGNDPVAYKKGNSGYQSGKYNDSDITISLSRVKALLNTSLNNWSNITFQGIQNPSSVNNDSWGNKIKLSSDLVVLDPKYAPKTFLSAFLNIVGNANHTGPLLLNMYPYQLDVPVSQAVFSADTNSLKTLVNNLMHGPNDGIDAIVQSKGFMIGETGWPNAGTPGPTQYCLTKTQCTTTTGTPASTQQYFSDVIDFANKNNVPVLAFEAYDQLYKSARANDPENHYGLFKSDNDAWITVNQNGININAANSGSQKNPFYFDPSKVILVYPGKTSAGAGITGNIVVKKTSGQQMVPFDSSAVSALKMDNGDSLMITVNCSPGLKPMVCEAKNYSNGKFAEVIPAMCTQAGLGSMAFKYNQINIAEPASTMCTGAKPKKDTVTFSLDVAPTYNGCVSYGGSSHKVAGKNVNVTVNKAGGSFTLTYNCSGGVPASCPITPATQGFSCKLNYANGKVSVASGSPAACSDTSGGINVNAFSVTGGLPIGQPNPSVCN